MARIARPCAVVAAALLLAGCTGTADPPAPPAGPAGRLVLQVDSVGGLTGPVATRNEVPEVSVYADGRVVSRGPTDAVHPPPALPTVLVQRIDAAELAALVRSAEAARIPERGDLGSPPIADAQSVRFTLVRNGTTYVREVYALREASPSAAGLTPEQTAARRKLRALGSRLEQLAGAASDPYPVTAVAALARPWTDPQDGLEHRPVTWPGPGLPGTPFDGPPGTGCVVATGEDARAVLAAATGANVLTPWVASDASRWAVAFRPLLPHESTCADLREG